MNSLQKTAFGSLAVSLVVLGAKYVAYLLTGSIALYSDALESIIKTIDVGARTPEAPR